MQVSNFDKIRIRLHEALQKYGKTNNSKARSERYCDFVSFVNVKLDKPINNIDRIWICPFYITATDLEDMAIGDIDDDNYNKFPLSTKNYLKCGDKIDFDKNSWNFHKKCNDDNFEVSIDISSGFKKKYKALVDEYKFKELHEVMIKERYIYKKPLTVNMTDNEINEIIGDYIGELKGV